jgi:hypothetical protein
LLVGGVTGVHGKRADAAHGAAAVGGKTLENRTMPPYKSYFASPESVNNRWKLGDDKAKTVWELWDMAWGELQTTYKEELVNDARGFFTQKLGLYDDPDTVGRYESATVTISEDALSRLVTIQRILLMMRSFYTAGQKEICRLVWRGILSRAKAEDTAKQLARDFNVTYAPEELSHYLQYLTDKPNKNPLALKPYAVPGKKEGTFTLQVWCK